jgi:hypothetical protein
MRVVGDAERVALRVREHEPSLTELLPRYGRQAGCAQYFEAADLLLNLVHE